MIALTTPEQIAFYRLLTLKQGLQMEIKGFKMSRGRTCYSIIKEEFKLKGNKQKVYDQFVKIIESKKGL